MTALAIPNWNQRFETAQSRNVGELGWIPCRRSFLAGLRSQEPNVAMAMLDLVFLAASMPDRGVFNDGGRDLTVDDIASCVGKDPSLIAAAISALGAAASSSGREGERERGKEVSSSEAEDSSVSRTKRDPVFGSDTKLRLWILENWNALAPELPTVVAVGEGRLRLTRAFLKNAGGDKFRLLRSIEAFGKWDFAIEKKLGVDCFLRAKNRDRHLEWAETGPPNGRPKNYMPPGIGENE